MSYNIFKDIIYTEVSCENTKHAALGIENQKWLPCGFRLNNIAGFKLYMGEDDEPERGMTTIYVDGMEYIIQIPYEEFVKLMKE